MQQHAKVLSSSDGEASRRASLLRSLVYAGIALGCNLSWVMMAFQSLGLYRIFSNPEKTLDETYLLSIITATLTLFCIGLFSEKARQLLKRTIPKIIIPIGASASILVLLVPGLPEDITSIICGIFSGLFSSMLIVHLGISLSIFKIKQVVIISAMGHMLAPWLFSLFLAFNPPITILICAATAPVTMIFLHLSLRELNGYENKSSGQLPKQTTPKNKSSRQKLWRQILPFGLYVFIAGLIFETARTIYIQIGFFASPDFSYRVPIQITISIAITVGAIILTFAAVKSKNRNQLNRCYYMTIALLLVGILLLPLTAIFPNSSVHLPYIANIVTFQLFDLIMWVLICGMCQKNPNATIKIFAFIRMGRSAGPLLGIAFGRIVHFEMGSALEVLFVVMILFVVLLLIVIMSLFARSEKTREKELLDSASDQRQKFIEKCNKTIEVYELSSREGEVLVLLAKGRNLPYIQKEFNLSRSTVSTHKQHIYQKLGIHSQQSLIDLVQSMEI